MNQFSNELFSLNKDMKFVQEVRCNLCVTVKWWKEGHLKPVKSSAASSGRMCVITRVGPAVDVYEVCM